MCCCFATGDGRAADRDLDVLFTHVPQCIFDAGTYGVPFGGVSGQGVERLLVTEDAARLFIRLTRTPIMGPARNLIEVTEDMLKDGNIS
jgi:hypothetical protein